MFRQELGETTGAITRDVIARREIESNEEQPFHRK
jgi:hypothetical protein